MSKHNILVGSLITVVVVALVGFAAYEYQTNRKPAPQPSYSQLKAERDTAVKAVAIHDSVNQRTEADLTKQVTDAKTKLVAVCAQLRTLKAVNPACN